MLTHSFCPGVTRGLANLVFATSMMVTGLSSLPAMAAETLLTVVSGDGTETAFTRDRLESLPQHAFRTETQWTWEEKEFSGPLLTDVLAEVGISDGTVELVADDGYQVQLNIEDSADYLTKDYPIIATRTDGQPFPVDEMGPLWVIFPYDGHPELEAKPVYDISIWQLVKIVDK
ncbi:MAG: hypothetical protein CML50_21625 [Rhodobacteraceae bacterium]|uniref:Uncharacterized protein n=1 Tax=Salipiger profundus TaxID=1229727 RepID=A0A1U7D279_9RHOB|nr:MULTISPECIES: molybdopterin-dependent oxidoreductase [Salipiger]APX22251.1 hypothetical protein Ga0080559_TMP1455 [Salipiger profundus]MAB08598.1 hypothetical protein [Paracoccaceae bacterium]GGA30079.1 oxidoreductase [Salipiger profundus]